MLLLSTRGNSGGEANFTYSFIAIKPDGVQVCNDIFEGIEYFILTEFSVDSLVLSFPDLRPVGKEAHTSVEMQIVTP
jgi:hypothetical protein